MLAWWFSKGSERAVSQRQGRFDIFWILLPPYGLVYFKGFLGVSPGCGRGFEVKIPGPLGFWAVLV